MLDNDLSGLSIEEYNEVKLYLKKLYDFDSICLKPLSFPYDIAISWKGYFLVVLINIWYLSYSA